MECFSLIKEDLFGECLDKSPPHKSMGPNGMHPCVLREVAEAKAQLPTVIFERSQRTGEVPED